MRRRDTDDRRRHVVEITSEGRQAVTRAEKARETIEDEILGALNAEDRRTLKKLVTRALEGLAARTPV